MANETDDRIHALDVLRGFALLGMLVVHFHQRMRVEVTGFEDLIGWGVYMGLEQKAWGVFALLFGVGFALLLRRLVARGVDPVPVFLRRFATLAAFGLTIQLFFGFHILFEYAIWGLWLLAARNASTRALFFLAAFAAMARPVASECVAWWAWATHHPLGPNVAGALRAAAETAANEGTYAQALAARWALFVGTTPGDWRGLLPDANLTLFVLGHLAVRHGLVDAPLRHVRTICGWMTFGAVSWLLAWFALDKLPEVAAPGAQWPLAIALGLIQDQWLALTYAGAAWLALASWPAWTARLAPVGAAGRMAFTNYCVQAAAVDVLASGYGFGLRLRPFAYVGTALAFFALQAAISNAWLARFRYGPIEVVWRAASFARWPTMRRESDRLPAP